MLLTSSRFTNIGMGEGFTTNFQVQYDDTMLNQANAIANADDIVVRVQRQCFVEFYQTETM